MSEDQKQSVPLDTKRHSLAHILAAAMIELYPDAKLGIGPTIENGFYYDFDLGDITISTEDFAAIEAKMRQIIGKNLPFERIETDRDSASKKLQDAKQTYKVELLEDIPVDETVSFYVSGDFIDLCRGPHVVSTKELQGLGWKLDRVAGAYWRGSEKNPMLQRVYGVAFENKEALKEWEHLQEEAARRDHRKLGQELGLFTFHPYSPGIPFFLPAGNIMRLELEKFSREISYGDGYQEVRLPQMFHADLWKTSGHWDHYSEDMFKFKIEEQDFSLKPMNCPGHMLVFKNTLRSYRDLPIRYAELTTLHRNEVSGSLGGMTRVRAFCQDDAHLFVTPEQIETEVQSLIGLVKVVYATFGMHLKEVTLSTRPEKFLGDLETWDKAELALEKILQGSNLPFVINPGDGAFYGPKIDFRVQDALGRLHQVATIQLDFQLPARFELEYIDEHGERKRPVVIHRAMLGSIERFMGLMVEHFAGNFPLWLSPEHVVFASVSEEFIPVARALAARAKAAGLRVTIDDSNESVGKKVRTATARKVPYIVICGKQEADGGELTVRVRGQEQQVKLSADNFFARAAMMARERCLKIDLI